MKNKDLKIKLPTKLEIFKGMRKTWKQSPIQKVVPNKKKKSREESKQEFKKQLREEL